jgi:pyruvate dehydrogenase E2 component (dihydrolipoamide acetyltransferase)
MPSPAVAPPPAAGAGGPDGLVAGIAFRTLRTGDGAPVALIHGFGAEGAAWRPFVGRLALANPVVALDLPSHGGSAAVEGGLEALVGRVEAALLAAGLGRLHLVGHSLGGAVAAALAAAGALDVASLTLLAPAGLGARIDRDFLEAFLAAETESALTVAMRRLVADPADLPPGLVRATLRARAARGTDALARLAATLFPGGAQGFGIGLALGRLSCPVRVVTGLADAILPPPSLGALPPSAALHGLPGVGHLPQVERADLVARLVAETVRSAG